MQESIVDLLDHLCAPSVASIRVKKVSSGVPEGTGFMAESAAVRALIHADLAQALVEHGAKDER